MVAERIWSFFRWSAGKTALLRPPASTGFRSEPAEFGTKSRSMGMKIGSGNPDLTASNESNESLAFLALHNMIGYGSKGGQ